MRGRRLLGRALLGLFDALSFLERYFVPLVLAMFVLLLWAIGTL